MKTSLCVLASTRLHALVCSGVAAFVLASIVSSNGQLTPADLPGPDGIVYPDWRHAGIASGIPTNLVVRANIANPQWTDIAAALETAAANAAAAGGEIVTIPAGTYYLSRPVLIRQGERRLARGRTRFQQVALSIPGAVNSVRFYQHPVGAATLYNNTWIQAHADPNGLNRIAIYAKNAGAVDSTRVLCTEQVKSPGSLGRDLLHDDYWFNYSLECWHGQRGANRGGQLRWWRRADKARCLFRVSCFAPHRGVES